MRRKCSTNDIEKKMPTHISIPCTAVGHVEINLRAPVLVTLTENADDMEILGKNDRMMMI